MALILGIETSCDETAAAVYDDAAGAVRHALASRPASHRPYGGVVPELASRDHAGLLMGLLDELGLARPPDLVACAAGPGLAGCLAAGLGLAQALAYAWRVPLAPVNHLEGHLLSPFLEPPAGFGPPYLAVLASGGHSLLVHVRGRGDYEVLGSSLDDAAGEAFDKTGQLLGLDFPGGAALEKLAATGDPAEAPLAPALRGRPDCMLSFAGLKTAARRLLAAGAKPADVAASFQAAVIETLATKAARALELAGCAWLAVVGGVARNQSLRERFDALGAERGVSVCYPPARWCTDNAAMIAYAGRHRAQQGHAARIRPRWSLAEL
ncbi:MAG: tRNA (adenosine(37)-N6)-threonylcarbamoyltransferase complex transferase subunit TsaD [Betaproteobacteria bacterium AqS2]|uniref:tRNA N6-adenosine threonylcarbamoyltransferase n=1 Tax=Candidatus Amphirhobacter heronislandensis TaxID=1732024 RepID=A0A930Y202_9GAMM|nr:tRNA (adenosine(37)-N6)-threonylcarbamoyltransferase complex transferase subunit TsaD [Betaproteobacteria bacterium AqS2]